MPLAGCDDEKLKSWKPAIISTHTPLAGRDFRLFRVSVLYRISTHTPLAGRDSARIRILTQNLFLLTRPLRDVTFVGLYKNL